MTGGWAATNTLRRVVRRDYDLPVQEQGYAALALVEAALDAAEKLDQEIVLWSQDANDGEFAIWSEDKIMAAWQALAAALRAVREGEGRHSMSDVHHDLAADFALIVGTLECPNADAPFHTSAGCTWCAGTMPALDAAKRVEALLREQHAEIARLKGELTEWRTSIATEKLIWRAEAAEEGFNALYETLRTAADNPAISNELVGALTRKVIAASRGALAAEGAPKDSSL